MCGIAGIYNRESGAPVTAGQVNTLLGAIRHRGPETAGMLLDGPAGLGHDRLSIIDLEGGLQPIANEDGPIWVICNGEIFNYLELRAALIKREATASAPAPTARSSFTCTKSAGPACLDAFIGQYAFAVWDANRRHPAAGPRPAGRAARCSIPKPEAPSCSRPRSRPLGRSAGAGGTGPGGAGPGVHLLGAAAGADGLPGRPRGAARALSAGGRTGPARCNRTGRWICAEPQDRGRGVDYYAEQLARAADRRDAGCACAPTCRWAPTSAAG